MSADLTIVIPTQGRATLPTCLASMRPLRQGDVPAQILVVADTHSPLLMDVRALCLEERVTYLELDGGSHNWGYCLPPDAAVEAPGLMAASRRRYAGPMLEILLGAGSLTITPEHPVLTERGWIAAGQLNEGNHLIRACFDERRLSGEPDIQRQPSEIGQLFYALREQGVDERVRGLGMEFNSNRSNSEVEIVSTDRLLWDDAADAASLEPAEQIALSLPYLLAWFGLPTHRAAIERLFACTSAESRRLASLDESLHRFRVVNVAKTLAVAVVSDGHSSIGQPLLDAPMRYVKTPSDCTDRLPAFIATDQIRNIRRFPYDGHVYDLQTRSGWYLADGLIVHNSQLQYGYDLALGDYVMNIGDDDVYEPGAFEVIRNAIEELPSTRPLLFRALMHPSVSRPCGGPLLLWGQRGLIRRSRVTGQNLIAPNVPARLGVWTDDFIHLEQTVNLWDGLVEWRDEVICKCY